MECITLTPGTGTAGFKGKLYNMIFLFSYFVASV